MEFVTIWIYYRHVIFVALGDNRKEAPLHLQIVYKKNACKLELHASYIFNI